MIHSEAPEESTGFAIEDVLEILERRRWWLVLGAILGLALGTAAYFVLPAVYTAQTTILVEPQEVPADYVRPVVDFDVAQRIFTLHQRVTSYANLNELIDRLGPERLDPSGTASREVLMNRIRRGLTVEIDQSGGRGSGASVFGLFYSGRDPVVVADVATELASLFISENIKDRTRQAAETAAFLDRELDRLRVEVTEQEEELRRFRQERMGSLPDQLDTNLRALDRMNLELAGNLESQESISQRIALLNRQLETARSARAGAAASDRVLVLEKLRGELLVARRIYTDQHPNVVHLEREVERLEREIEEAGPQRPSPALLAADPATQGMLREIDNARLELDRRQRREQTLREEIAALEARVAETPAREEELASLTRDYANLTSTYQTLLAKKYEAAIARNLEQAQKGERFKVLRPARVPGSPSFPDLKIVLPAGLALGLIGVALLIALQEFRNPAFRSVQRLTRTIGLPVVASIPRIDNERIFEQPPSGDVDPRLVVYTAPESAPAEQYRGFAPIFYEDESRRVVLVTSAARGDGKSLSTMNLALTFACDLNKRVLLIDGDLRRPTAHRLVRVSRRRGLSNVLRKQLSLDQCAVNSKIPRLTVLPAGPSVRNPLALLTSQTFLDLLEEAKTKYDLVFIDSPPLLPVVDTKFLKKVADVVLFVVRADSTPREAVVRSMRDLRDVAGVIFNEVSPGSFHRYYYYDAYSRYAYGEPSENGNGRNGRG